MALNIDAVRTLSVEQAAKLVDVSPTVILNAIRRKKLAATRIARGQYETTVQAIYDWERWAVEQGADISAGVRRPIPLMVRFRVLNRSGFAYAYCGRRAPDVELEIDHIVPLAKGGANDESNLTAACFDCNRGKKAMLLDGDN